MFSTSALKTRWPFLAFLMFYLIFCFTTFRQFDGLCSDEREDYRSGAVLLKYYKGETQEALKLMYNSHNFLYPAILIKLSFSKDLNLARLSLLNLLFGSILFWLIYEFLYFGFGDPRWALIGPVALFFTPRFLGEISTNPQDFPFAVFYFLSLGTILLKDKWFPGRVFRVLGLGIVFGLTFSIRIAGLSLLPLYGLFRLYEVTVGKEWEKGRIGKWLLKEFLEGTAVFAVSQVVLCAVWPYVGADYFHHLPETLTVSRVLPFDDWILFGGKLIHTVDRPWNYLPGWMTVMTPLFILAFFAYAIIRWVGLWNNRVYFLAALAFGLNVALYYALKPVIYNGIRHYLFLTPPLVLMASIGIIDFFHHFKKNSIRWIGACLLAANLLVVGIHMVRLFPYEYLYFNELVGGTAGANGKYEMDYWWRSLKEATLWLEENEIKDPQKVYWIKYESYDFDAYFTQNMKGSTDIKDEDADFCLVLNGKRGYSLPKAGKVIHVVEREGVPLFFILRMPRSKT